MSSFLDSALEHAAHGLYVFPVARDKSTITAHGFKDASTDPEMISAWWAKHPSANPGFAPGPSDIAVLDVDYGLTDKESFIAWRTRNNLPATYTVRSGSRPEFKVHMYFRGAMRDIGIWELDGCSGQVKSLGGYVLAAGSAALHGEKHDKPGAPYEVIDGTLGIFAPTPDAIRNLRKPAVAQSNNSKVAKTAWSLPVGPGENRTGFLLEQTGAIRNLGCGVDAIRARMIELNSDPDIISVPVDDERLEATAANCAKFPVPEVAPIPVFGSQPVIVVDTDNDADAPDAIPRPKYPDHVWNGTAYGDFADICSEGNYIPKKFFSESLRTVTGSIVGDRLSCPVYGANPRAFTIKIAGPGSGKGTSEDRVRELFGDRWEGTTRTEGALLFGPKDIYWRKRGIGVCIINPASAPGLMKSIEPRKMAKNETPNPMEVWEPLPRVISIQEEIRGMFANFANESTGAGLESILCELYDRTSFSSTATKDRAAASSRMMYGLLGGITKEEGRLGFSIQQS